MVLTPRIRRAGQARIHAWLKKQGARSSAAVATAAVEAAESQHTIVPAQHMGESIVAALAREVLTLNEELAELDALIGQKVAEHRHTRILLSMPGFGPVLAAEFLGATGGDLTVFETADRFAGVAGLAPHPGTRAGSPVITTGPGATTADSSGCSTSPGFRR
ncbi:transposase [Arthrobacter sp. UYCo732]|uniref:transposase n=1 Tax=Arthrobacter sp. UYCo732 TaxID=3156336 RepID=UPI003398A764